MITSELSIGKLCFTVVIFAWVLLVACKNSSSRADHVKYLTNSLEQDNIYKYLNSLTGNIISTSGKNDSLAFLVLPVQESCPACRKKTIDSIINHKSDLKENHFIILTASGGRKTINSYFLEQNQQLPTIENKLFLDSVKQASRYKLYTSNPVLYYAANKKVYKKVTTIPATIRNDLNEFFTGQANNK